MPNSDLQTAQAVIERLHEGLAATALANDSPTPIFATASFGIKQLDPEVSVGESIDHADKAMYAAKTAGRNRTCIWNPSK